MNIYTAHNLFKKKKCKEEIASHQIETESVFPVCMNSQFHAIGTYSFLYPANMLPFNDCYLWQSKDTSLSTVSGPPTLSPKCLTGLIQPSVRRKRHLQQQQSLWLASAGPDNGWRSLEIAGTAGVFWRWRLVVGADIDIA